MDVQVTINVFPSYVREDGTGLTPAGLLLLQSGAGAVGAVRGVEVLPDLADEVAAAPEPAPEVTPEPSVDLESPPALPEDPSPNTTQQEA